MCLIKYHQREKGICHIQGTTADGTGIGGTSHDIIQGGDHVSRRTGEAAQFSEDLDD
jgi:hypothetical protein